MRKEGPTTLHNHARHGGATSSIDNDRCGKVKTIRVGTFDARGCSKMTKRELLDKEVSARRVDACAIQETKTVDEDDNELNSGRPLLFGQNNRPAPGSWSVRE